MMATSEAQKKASAKYNAANTRRVTVKFNLKTDADLVAWLDKQDKMQTAIKAAIREALKKNSPV